MSRPATLTYRIADVDCPSGQDLRAQAATVSEPANHFASGQSLQVIARFAQTNSANLDLANLELFSNQMVQSHAPSDYIAASFTRSQLEVVFVLQGFNGFSLNQRELTIGQRFRESTYTQCITVAFQPNTGNGTSLIHRMSRYTGCGSDVDEFDGSSVHEIPQPVSSSISRRLSEGETSALPTSATRFFGDRDALLEDIDCHVSFVLGDNQRWRDPNRARAAAKEQDATVKGQFDDAVA